MRLHVVLGIAIVLLGPAASAQPGGDPLPSPPASQVVAPPAPPASPPPASPAPTLIEHHRSGLFLACEVGYAGESLSRNEVKASGRGFDLRLAAGGLATPWLALFVGYSNFQSSAVTYESGGVPLVSDDTYLDAGSFFAGARGYLPYAFYLEASLGTLTERLDIGPSGTVGMMGELGAGKEWRLVSGLTLLTGLRLGAGRVPRTIGAPVSARHLGVYVGLGYTGD
jgi:hypothetical protein